MKTTGSLDFYHVHLDFGMTSANVLNIARQILTHKQSPEKYLFTEPQTFSELRVLKTFNLAEGGSHSPLRFPLSEGFDFPAATK